MLRDHYRKCRHLIFPGEEDYGIVPVEAMACGTPVVAFGRGGATETIAEGVSGIFFHEQLPDSLWCAVEEAATKEWDRSKIRAQAEKFDTQNFLDGLKRIVDETL